MYFSKRLTPLRPGGHKSAPRLLIAKFLIPKSIFKNFYLSLKSYFLILKTMHEKKIFRFLKFFHSIFVVDTDDFSKKFFFRPNSFCRRFRQFWTRWAKKIFWNFCSTFWRFFDKMSSTKSKVFYMRVLFLSHWSFCAQNLLKRFSYNE